MHHKLYYELVKSALIGTAGSIPYFGYYYYQYKKCVNNVYHEFVTSVQEETLNPEGNHIVKNFGGNYYKEMPDDAYFEDKDSEQFEGNEEDTLCKLSLAKVLSQFQSYL